MPNKPWGKGTEVLKQRDEDTQKDYRTFMRRQPRLDAPGVLHQRIKIFRSDSHRQDFLDRLATLCRDGRGGYFVDWW